MSQRIDLYRDDLRPSIIRGDLRRLLLLAALLLLPLLAFGAFSTMALWRVQGELQALEAERSDLESRSTAAAAALAARGPDPTLTRLLLEAQRQLDGRRWAQDQLAVVADEEVAFSSVLESLGRQRPEPLWLTRVEIDAAGAELGLGGRVAEAEALSEFVERLSAEPAFRGRAFSEFVLRRPIPGQELGTALHFDFATSCAAMPEGCDPATDDAGGSP